MTFRFNLKSYAIKNPVFNLNKNSNRIVISTKASNSSENGEKEVSKVRKKNKNLLVLWV